MKSAFWAGVKDGILIATVITVIISCILIGAMMHDINTLAASMNSLEANMAALGNEVGR